MVSLPYSWNSTRSDGGLTSPQTGKCSSGNYPVARTRRKCTRQLGVGRRQLALFPVLLHEVSVPHLRDFTFLLLRLVQLLVGVVGQKVYECAVVLVTVLSIVVVRT